MSARRCRSQVSDTRLRWRRWIVAGLLIVAAAWCLDQRLFLARYGSYLLEGYDPLTVPVSWFKPVYALAEAPAVDLPAAQAATIPAAALAAAADYAEAQGSIALLVARGGRVELERYWSGFDGDDLFNPQSMSKTVLALVLGIAIADGAINSVDDAIGTYLDEWRDDPRGAITIGQLLQMSGGLAQLATDYTPVPWSPAVWQHFGTDFNKAIFTLAQADAPGTHWDYNNNETNLLGIVIERATGRSYQAYLAEKLWQPLQLGPALMYLDQPGGNVMKSCCILSRPQAWLKLGQLMLDRGRYGGQQLVPAAWIDAMLRPAETNPGYGYQVWLGDGSLWDIAAEPPPPEVYTWWGSEPYAADDIYTFVGHGYQSVWVIPSQELVIVRGTRSWSAERWDTSRIPNTLVRALAAQAD